jgi:hypothetical protein
MDQVSLEHRAHVIAGRNSRLLVGGAKYQRVYDTALYQLREAVEQAIDDLAKVLK